MDGRLVHKGAAEVHSQPPLSQIKWSGRVSVPALKRKDFWPARPCMILFQT